MNRGIGNSRCRCRPLEVPWVQEDLVFLDVLETLDLPLDLLGLVDLVDLVVPLVLGVQVVQVIPFVQVGLGHQGNLFALSYLVGQVGQDGQVCQAYQGGNGVGSGRGIGNGWHQPDEHHALAPCQTLPLQWQFVPLQGRLVYENNENQISF